MDQADRADDSSGGESIPAAFIAIQSNTIQRALASQPWKEYTAEKGRKYWYNTETKTSSWEMPEAYKAALAQTSASRPSAP